MKINGEKVIGIRALLDRGWTPIKERALRYMVEKAGRSIYCAFEMEPPRRGGTITHYEMYLPRRRRDESPVQYYRRTKCVDDNYTRRYKGWYYCNPAHCKHRWRKKAERDEHLDRAYGALA